MVRVLLIDDIAEVRETLRMYLEAMGHDVFEADTGRAGLEQFKQHGADLVISDIIMPDLNGVDLIKQLRRLDRRLPIVAMSGYPDELNQVLRLGVRATLNKPPKLEDVREIMEHFFDKQSA